MKMISKLLLHCSTRFSLHLCIVSLCLPSLNYTSYDRLILDLYLYFYLENERDVWGKECERKRLCILADTGPPVNGWMNLGEKGCLWAAESVAARLINEALARGPEDQQQLRYQGGELIDRYPCLLIYQSTSRSTTSSSNGTSIRVNR